jgi:hypothetical protein
MYKISSHSLYNTLIKDPYIIIIIVTDHEALLHELSDMNLFNHVVLISDKMDILYKYSLYAITQRIFTNKLHDDCKIIRLVKNDKIIQNLKSEQSRFLVIKSLLADCLEIYELEI